MKEKIYISFEPEKPTKEELTKIIGYLGDETWSDFDISHSVSGVATNGEEIIGLFYDDKSGKISDTAYKATSLPEYRDVLPSTKEAIEKMVLDGELEKFTVKEIIEKIDLEKEQEQKVEVKKEPKKAKKKSKSPKM